MQLQEANTVRPLAVKMPDIPVLLLSIRCFTLYEYKLERERERERTASVVYWSEFLATDPKVQVRFPALQKKLVGLERGPLRLVSTTEELLDRKVAAPV
jgi:hypothetical protein